MNKPSKHQSGHAATMIKVCGHPWLCEGDLITFISFKDLMPYYPHTPLSFVLKCGLGLSDQSSRAGLCRPTAAGAEFDAERSSVEPSAVKSPLCLGWALPSPEPQHLLVGSPLWVKEQGKHCQLVGTQK